MKIAGSFFQTPYRGSPVILYYFDASAWVKGYYCVLTMNICTWNWWMGGCSLCRCCGFRYKRFAQDRPVGVALVRALYGVVSSENATGGVLVTTSRFTRGDRAFQKSVQNRLWLRDYDSVVSWLNETRAI